MPGEISNGAPPPKRIIVDLTHPLVSSAIPAFPGHPCYTAHKVSSIASGDSSTVHALTLGTHTGTHLDAPNHFFEDGATVEQLDLSLLTAAPAILIDLRGKKKARERIEWADLEEYEGRMKKGVVVLLCTGNSSKWCSAGYGENPFLDGEAARRVMETGVRVIGVDMMSPDEVTAEKGDCGEVHRAVLGRGGVIVENLNFGGLERLADEGTEMEDLVVSLLPLNLAGCDGSPVRAVAWL